MANVLTRLARTIESRIGEDERKSYAAKLFKRGPEKCAEKFGEEAIEAIIEAIKDDKVALRSEAADVLYHLFVMLAARDVSLAEVEDVLAQRVGTSGIAEKASRT